jgi:hypothetical protein
MTSVTDINLNSNAILNVGHEHNAHIASPQTSQRFGDVLASVMNKDDIINELNSFGLPINIRNTPRYVNSMSELSSGSTIAPNIVQKMAQDDEYLQEIKGEIYDWFFVHVPTRQREVTLRYGDNVRIIAGMSIDENGKIVKWSGAQMISDHEGNRKEDDIFEVVYGKKMASNTANHTSQPVSNYDSNVDASVFSAIVGDFSLRLQRRDE